MQLLGLTIMVVVIGYLTIKLFKIGSIKEGFSTSDMSIGNISELGTDEAKPVEKDVIESINATIQAKITLLEDQLVLKKNKAQYETTIINMDDYINLLMMQQILNIKFDSGTQTTIDGLQNLNTLKACKEALNVSMKYLDKA